MNKRFDGIGREELERIAARALDDLASAEERIISTIIPSTIADYKHMLANLTATQERCTALFCSDRRKGWVLDAVRAWTDAESEESENAVRAALAKHDDDVFVSGGAPSTFLGGLTWEEKR